jgi:hypothetical protein
MNSSGVRPDAFFLGGLKRASLYAQKKGAILKLITIASGAAEAAPLQSGVTGGLLFGIEGCPAIDVSNPSRFS